MNPEDLDRELTRLFREQRRADEAAAPAFAELIARARAVSGGRAFARETRDAKWAWRAAIAAAASLALAIGLYLLRPSPEPRIPMNITAWKAPSDVLLQTPGVELLSRLPVLLPPAPVPGGGAENAPGARETTPRSTQTKVPQMKGVES